MAVVDKLCRCLQTDQRYDSTKAFPAARQRHSLPPLDPIARSEACQRTIDAANVSGSRRV